MPIYAADRLTAYYTGPLGAHRMHFWKTSVATPTTFIAAVRAVVNNFRFLQYGGTDWTHADYQAAGDNFSVPVAWTTISSTSPGVPDDADTVGEYLNFVGRSLTTGKRVRLFLFETLFGPGREMRLPPGSNTDIDNAVDQLDNVSPSVGAIDGAPVVWKTYTNLGINDYWVRRARTGA